MYSWLSVGAEKLVGVSPTRQRDRGALCVAVLPGVKVESSRIIVWIPTGGCCNSIPSRRPHREEEEKDIFVGNERTVARNHQLGMGRR